MYDLVQTYGLISAADTRAESSTSVPFPSLWVPLRSEVIELCAPVESDEKLTNPSIPP